MSEQMFKNGEIRAQIHELELSVHNYWEVLNQEGVWLFLATLGAWSVDQQNMQYIAAAVILIIFAHRVYIRAKENGFFTKQIKEIRDAIEKELDVKSDSYKSRTFDLQAIEEKLSSIYSLKSAWVYIVCVAFYILSVFTWFG